MRIELLKISNKIMGEHLNAHHGIASNFKGKGWPTLPHLSHQIIGGLRLPIHFLLCGTPFYQVNIKR